MANDSRMGDTRKVYKKKEVRKQVGFPHPSRNMTDRECMEELGHIPFPDQHRREDETVQEFITRDKREQWEVHSGAREYKKVGPNPYDWSYTSTDGLKKYERVMGKGWILVEDRTKIEPKSDWFGDMTSVPKNF